MITVAALHRLYARLTAGHRRPPLDTWSSASRQHYIDTGRYLRVGEPI